MYQSFNIALPTFMTGQSPTQELILLLRFVINFIILTPMKYLDFSSDENLVSSEDTIFIFHTVKISLPDFLDKLFTHFKGQ